MECPISALTKPELLSCTFGDSERRRQRCVARTSHTSNISHFLADHVLYNPEDLHQGSPLAPCIPWHDTFVVTISEQESGPTCVGVDWAGKGRRLAGE